MIESDDVGWMVVVVVVVVVYEYGKWMVGLRVRRGVRTEGVVEELMAGMFLSGFGRMVRRRGSWFSGRCIGRVVEDVVSR